MELLEKSSYLHKIVPPFEGTGLTEIVSIPVFDRKPK
jgi:hypothetical protein